MKHKKEHPDRIVYSPLKLLHSAYTDERPVVTPEIEEGFCALDRYLSPLSEEDRKIVFQTFCDIYDQNEKLAFTEGVRVGVRLAAELAI